MTLITKILSILLFVLCALVYLPLGYTQTIEPELSKKLDEFVKEQQNKLSTSGRIHLLVERQSDGSPVYRYNEDEFLHIASVQKLFISYAALKALGPSHTFATEIYSNWKPQLEKNSLQEGIAEGVGYGNKKKAEVVLYIRPYGDPLFQYEDALKIGRALLQRGYTSIDKLVVDKSLFRDPEEVKGRESYLAPQTAAAIEFNSFKIDVFPSASGSAAFYSVSPGFYGDVVSRVKTLRTKGARIDAIMTPDFNTFTNRGFPPLGAWRPTKFKILLDGKIGESDQPYTEYIAHPEPDSFYAYSFLKAFRSSGISVLDTIEYGIVPENTYLAYEHQSQPLSDILKRLNHYSNNFIAGQLLYAIGQGKDGVFSKERGLERLLEILFEIPDFVDSQSKNKLVIKDASGLSPENRISLIQVNKVLRAAAGDMSMYPSFISSLPRMGHDGTLHNRVLLSNKDEYNVRTSFYIDTEQRANGVWAKAGTVSGVSSLSGYLEAQSSQRFVFSIIIIGDIKKVDAAAIEDDIIKILLGIPQSK